MQTATSNINFKLGISMNPSQGLVTALNKMREMSVKEGSVYHQYIPVVTSDTSITEFGEPILDSNLTVVRNEFVGLLKRIVFTSVNTKLFKNPLSELEGERIPLGYAGQDIHVNPAKGRMFNINDFAGLLQKYDAQIATQYLTVNMDIQYPVTITRAKLKDAFTSWSNLEEFIMGMVNSLYNGAYIDMFKFTKALVTSAYTSNKVQVEKVDAPDSESDDKAFIKKVRELYTKFQLPSTNYNAWAKVNAGVDGAFPIVTWSEPSDIMVMIRADIEAEIDVEVLARAFHMSETDFLGRVIVVDDFNVYDDEGNKIGDGDNILGMIFDKSFFKIKTQDFEMDEFYNANSRCWNYYLNVVKMYNYSAFANAVVLATELPPTSGASA